MRFIGTNNNLPLDFSVSQVSQKENSHLQLDLHIGVKDMVLIICYYTIITISVLINGQRVRNMYDRLYSNLAKVCLTLSTRKLNNFQNNL